MKPLGAQATPVDVARLPPPLPIPELLDTASSFLGGGVRADHAARPVDRQRGDAGDQREHEAFVHS